MMNDNDIGITLSADDKALLAVLRGAGADIQAFAKQGGNSLRELQDAARGQTTAMEKLAGGMKTAFIGGGVAAAIITVKNAIEGVTMAMLDAQMQADKVKNSLSFAMGGPQAAQEIQYLRQVTDQLGVSFANVAPMYGRLAAATKGTNLEGRATREIFESIAQASVVMGLGVEETEGAMRALVQMVSKGQIQAEELRGQLGERLPRAFQLFAQSMGVTTGELSKLLEAGKVAPDVLAQFAATLKSELSGSLDEATTRLASGINRMGNEWLRLKQNIGEAGVSRLLSNEATGIANYMDSVNAHIEQAAKRGAGGIGQLSEALGYVIARAPFDALSFGANTLNGTINVLSGGFAGLRTNLNLVPNSFEAASRRTSEFASELPKAEAGLARLRELDAMPMNGDYFKAAVREAENYVKFLREAVAAKAAITGGNPTVEGIRAGGIAREKYMEQQAQRTKELADIRAKLNNVDKDYLPTLTKLHNAFENGALTQTEYVDLVGKLAKENYKAEKATRVHADAFGDFVRKLNEKLAAQAQELDSGRKLSESDKLRIQFNEELGSKYKKLTAAQLAQVDALLKALKAGEDQERTLKRLKAEYQAFVEFQDEVNAGYVAESKAREQGRLAVDAYVQGIAASAEQVALEQSLFGQSTRNRAIALEQYQIELDLKKQIAAINANAGFDQSQRAEEIARATAAAAIAKASAVAKADMAALQSLFDAFDNTAHDVFVNIFNDGSNAFKKLGQSLKAGLIDVLYQLTLKRWIINIGASVTGLGGSTLAHAAGGGGNLLGNVGMLGGLGGSFGAGLGAGVGSLLGEAGIMGGLDAGMIALQAGNIAGGLGTLAGVLGPIALGIGGIYALAKNLDHSGTPHTGGGSAYSAAGGLLDARTSVFNSGFTGIAYSDSTTDMTAKLVQSIVGILDTTATTFGKTAGYQAAASFADDSSKDGAWGSLFIKNLQGVITDWQAGGQSFRTFSDGSAGSAEYLAAISADVRTALDGIGLPAWATSMLDKLGDAPTLEQLAGVATEITATQKVLQALGASVKVFAGLSGEAVLNIISASGGLQAFSTSLGAYYENFYSEQEKFDAKLQALNTRLQDLAAGGAFADSSEQFFKAITEPTRANFRALIEAQDLTTTSGQATYAALLGLSGVVAELTPVTEAAAEAVQTLGTAALTLADLQKQFDGAAKTILNSTQYTAYRIQQIQQTLSAAGMDLSAQQITHATREQVLAGYQQALAAGNIEAASAILNVLDALTEVSAGFQGVTETSTSAAVAVQQVVTTLADVQGLFGNAARTLLNDVQYTAYQVAQIQATLGSVGINVTAADVMNATREQVLAGLGEMMAAGNLDAARAILSVVDALAQVSSGFQTVAATASNAAAIMQQRAGLESTLLNLTGNTAEIRARELAGLDASNRGLQQHIYAIQDAQQAVQDANSAYAAQESAINGLQSAAQRWIGTLSTATSLLDQISGSLGGAGGNREAQLWATVNGSGDIDERLSAAQELFSVITQTAATERAAQDNALANAKALLEYGQRLRDYVQGLKTGDLSTLTPAQKVAEALAQYQRTLAAARGGDQTALGNLQGVADTYLRLAREFDPSSYTTSVFTSVTDALDQLGAGLVSQNSPQVALLQAQLDATNAASASANALSADQIARLQTLQSVVQDLSAQAAAQSAIANAQVSSAQANLQTLGAAQLAAQQTLAARQQAVVDAQNAATAYMATLADVAVADPVPDILRALPEGIAAALAPLLNANPASTAAASAAAVTAQRAQIIRDYAATLPQDDTGARMLYDAAVANGVSSAELDAAMGFAPGSSLAWAVSHGLPAFAQGTNYVPRDMVAMVHQGEAIVPARYNPANGGNDALIAEIKALREEVRHLREQNNQGHLMGAMATHENTQQVTRATCEAASQAVHAGRLKERAALA